MGQEVIKILDDYFTGKFKQLNLYVLPQFMWLILLYYLMLNSFVSIIDKSNLLQNIGLKPILTYFPEIIIEKNELILQFLTDWCPFIIFLSIGLLLCGVILILLKEIIVIGEYKVIWNHSSYGISAFLWYSLIGITIYFYELMQAWFPLYVIVAYTLSKSFEIVKEKINKGDLTFLS
ncbi:hypothetical protein [Paenibacillus endoradicis]|uniref:hypothetical protein n=1 Tax=Paenibacillus endoradicis TaxID=2972487 RepID=UPI002158B40D|nr:hypothetical protein [Paenibacillus endoradicis]MCR8655845.1 hypothetical protein [Paenibacillus endoradicis]MCR8658171.1 hypothetical protein [Paenibacillus endoradicis]